MTDLLPCPFCGEQPKAHVREGAAMIQCFGQECLGPRTTAGYLDDAKLQWNKRTGAAAQSSQVPDGYILVPRKLSAENGAKAALIGEFSETVQIMDEDGEEHPMDVPVSWDTIKRIWDAAAEHFAAQPPAAPVEPEAWTRQKVENYFHDWQFWDTVAPDTQSHVIDDITRMVRGKTAASAQIEAGPFPGEDDAGNVSVAHQRLSAATEGLTCRYPDGCSTPGGPCPSCYPDPLEDLVQRFSAALLAKLKLARENRRNGWEQPDWEDACQRGLLRHIEKGDPRDVAAYCAFMWHHGWITRTFDEPQTSQVREA